MTNQQTDNEWIKKLDTNLYTIDNTSTRTIVYKINEIIDKINLPKPTEVVAPVDENTSDGYHTFKELYDHRIALFIALMKCNPSISWRANNNDDGTNREGRFVAGMHLDSGDISYHLPTDKRTELDGLGIQTTLNAPKRDGYTAKDVVERLNNWKHLKGTTPVEPINQERLREIKKKWKYEHIDTDPDSGLLIEKFLSDLQYIQSDSEDKTTVKDVLLYEAGIEEGKRIAREEGEQKVD